ncbi:UvrD-helicase domain-containing protein [Listeria innocua]|uniref:UvrD-helicase domain-containing protein n=1 Tax=Listeria innocua TaxID=1642 RepID=UPI00052ED17D|nr:ATP-dependent helicase [Listeria innocua]UPH66556.1 ATP-dependent helicase [Listeria innocua]WIH34688.1 ATP-dependent helicase [Listeria innocua]
MIIDSKTIIKPNLEFKIEAGPGAGKTEWLIAHIINVVQNSDILFSTRKVACITYTNTAVETILSRLGTSLSNRVEVTTIHSFLYRYVVKPYSSFIPEKYRVNISELNGHEDPFISYKHLKEWLADDSFDRLKHPSTKKQLLYNEQNYALRNWLLSMKCTLTESSAQFQCENSKAFYEGKRLISNANLNILNAELINYKKLYWASGYFDHEDILFFSHILIEHNPFILKVLCAKFPYLFIDEFQDTNPIQSFFVTKFRESGGIVGVIGDKAQAIYGFQGSDSSQFENFSIKEHCSYKILDNHRSSTDIVNFLKVIRTDLEQINCVKTQSDKVIIHVGSRFESYNYLKKIVENENLVSLSRDNITSNAMKTKIEGNSLNKKILKNYREVDSNNDRKRSIEAYIQAIELANNQKFKEAIKIIENLYKNQKNSKKKSLKNLIGMLKKNSIYKEATLKIFYDVLKEVTEEKIPGFRKGAIEKFYNITNYVDIAICMNIVDDNSNHITIHKSKGAEYNNVCVIDNDNLLKMLLNPDLTNEEHRIIYVAMSRAKKRLFIQLNDLTSADEQKLKKKYNVEIVRLN